MDDDARRRALSEVNVLRVIRHPFVIGYHRSFICDSTLHIVLDYAAGGDLGARVKAAKRSGIPFPESQVRCCLIAQGPPRHRHDTSLSRVACRL